MSVFVISCIVVITLLIYFNFKNKKFWNKVNKIKGLPTLPFIGNAHQLGTNSHSLFQDLYHHWKVSKGTTHKIQLGGDVMVVLSTPECVEVVLKHITQLNKPIEYSYFKPWLGDGLILSSGEKWRKQRKVITPTFHFKILEQFVSVFVKHSRTFVDLCSMSKGKPTDIFPMVNRCALDIICETAMGKAVDAQSVEESDYCRAVHELCQILIRRIFSAIKRIDTLFNLTNDSRNQTKCLTYLHSFSDKLIISRREEMKDEIAAAFSSSSTDLSQHLEGGSRIYRPFLDLLLLSKFSDGQPLDNKTIRDEVDTFVFAGHDTTSSAISFTLYLLSTHPEVQKKALEEQKAIFGTNRDKDPTYADLLEMKYLERVVKETLRLYPSVPYYGREFTEDILLPDGTDVPAGATLLISAYAIHRNPKYFPNPEVFDPDRFLGDISKEFGPFTYVPFSAGPRNCIGQKYAMLELKTLLSLTLRRLELLDAGPEYVLKLANEVTLKSVSGCYVRFTERTY